MLNNELLKAINEQITAEFYSSHMYLAMAAWLDSQNLHGAAHWMKLQAKEEATHAMKFFDYVLERGSQVSLKGIDAPPLTWPSPLAVFQAALEHERKVTAMINAIMDKAIASKDHATAVFLQWFVSEQVEEEASADQVVAQLQMVGDSTNGLLMLDHQLGKRD